MSTDPIMLPIHPGEVLMLEYLQPLEVTQHRLERDRLGPTLNQIQPLAHA
jgi:plasmid maintenance system antidote protein VapI